MSISCAINGFGYSGLFLSNWAWSITPIQKKKSNNSVFVTSLEQFTSYINDFDRHLTILAIWKFGRILAVPDYPYIEKNSFLKDVFYRKLSRTDGHERTDTNRHVKTFGLYKISAITDYHSQVQRGISHMHEAYLVLKLVARLKE